MGKTDPVAYYKEEDRKFRVLIEELDVLLAPIKKQLGNRIWFNILPTGMPDNPHTRQRLGGDVFKFFPQDYPDGARIAAKLKECHKAFSQLDLFYRSLSDSEKQKVGAAPKP